MLFSSAAPPAPSPERQPELFARRFGLPKVYPCGQLRTVHCGDSFQRLRVYELHSGELRGELYRQGREIGRVWTGDPEGFRPNLPFTWGAQHNGLTFFNDLNTGLWIVKLGKAKEKGSTNRCSCANLC